MAHNPCAKSRLFFSFSFSRFSLRLFSCAGICIDKKGGKKWEVFFVLNSFQYIGGIICYCSSEIDDEFFFWRISW